MSRWILRAAILFSCLAALSAAGLLLASVEVAKDGVPVVLSSLALAALAPFAILLAVGTWRKWRKSAGRSKPLNHQHDAGGQDQRR
jgi:hypothetical protein